MAASRGALAVTVTVTVAVAITGFSTTLQPEDGPKTRDFAAFRVYYILYAPFGLRFRLRY
jgi:hypothetical protein